MAYQLMSKFLIQKDAIFNTIKLNISVSILFGIINTIFSFFVAYIFMFLEIADIMP